MHKVQGFSLIETTIALFILSFGLLAAGQSIYISAASSSLARSKGTAAVAAQNKMEYLADRYRQDLSAADLTEGVHGPEEMECINPMTATALNRFNVTWTVGDVPDPRPGKKLKAKLISVTVTPSRSGGTVNTKFPLNKVLEITAVLNPRTQ